MTIINSIAGDKTYAWQFTLKDSDNNAIDITGATGTFRAQLETGTALAVEGAIALVTAASGICKYIVQSGNFDTAGRYYAEVEILLSSGEVSTFDDIVINIKKQLPRSI